MSRPSDKQIAFAERLGVDLPTGATKAEVSELISHALRRQRIEQSGRHELTDEVAAAVGFDDLKVSPSRLRLIEAVRRSGIRVGSLIERSDTPVKRGAVARLDLEDMAVFRFDLGYQYRESYSYSLKEGVATLNWRLLYQPPAGYLHTCVVPIVVLKRGTDKETRTAFMSYADQRLNSRSRFRNEYGEFWLRSEVERFVADFNRHQQEELARREELARETVKLVPGFCVSCGSSTPDRTVTRCRECPPSGRLPRERYCLQCGSRFVGERADPASSATHFCPDHRGAASA